LPDDVLEDLPEDPFEDPTDPVDDSIFIDLDVDDIDLFDIADDEDDDNEPIFDHSTELTETSETQDEYESSEFLEAIEDAEQYAVTGSLGDSVLPDSSPGDKVELSASILETWDRDQVIIWRQVTGAEVKLSDHQGGAPTFRAPKLLEAEELVFEVATVVDGEVFKETVSVVVDPAATVKRPESYDDPEWEEDWDTAAPEASGKESNLVGLMLGGLFSAFRIGTSDKRRK
jgi:hypothetical protein